MNKGTSLPFINEPFLLYTIRTLLKLNQPVFAENVKKLLALLDKEFYSRQPNIYTLLTSIEVISEFLIDNVKDRKLMQMRIEVVLPDEYKEIKDDIVVPCLEGEFDIEDTIVQKVKETVSKAYLIHLIRQKHEEVNRKANKIDKGNILTLNKDIADYCKSIEDLSDEINTFGSSTEEKLMKTHDDLHTQKFLSPAYDFVKNDVYRLKTGLKMLNDMVDPSTGEGFQPRFYVFAGKSNSYKSMLLSYVAKWMMICNHDRFMPIYEKGIQPTVLKITLENLKNEDIDRDFMIFNDGEQFRHFNSFEQAAAQWNNTMKKSCISLSIGFGEDFDKSTITPQGIYNLIRSYELKSNVKVIGIVLDYLKLLEDDKRESELRLKIGNIATGLHEIVKKKQIPVVTAHHLNREGDKMIDELTNQGKSNVCKYLFEGYLGESKLVEDKADMVIFIHRELSQFDGKWYLTFKRGKSRCGTGGTEYFVHPLRNGFLLDDDWNSDRPLSLQEIGDYDHSTVGFSNSLRQRGRITEAHADHSMSNSHGVNAPISRTNENSLLEYYMSLTVVEKFIHNMSMKNMYDAHNCYQLESITGDHISQRGHYYYAKDQNGDRVLICHSLGVQKM